MSVKKDGFLFLRNVECTLKVEGKTGSTFLFHPCCPFFLQELSFSFFFFVSSFPGTVCYLSFISPLFYLPSTLWHLSDPHPSSSFFFTVCFLYFRDTARRKVEVLSFCWHHTPLYYFFSLFSHLRWELELRQGTDQALSLSACTHHTGLSVREHRVFGFVWFGLKTVEVEGEGGTSQEVHKHEGNLNQKATVDKTGAQQVPWEMSACWSADAAGRRGGFQCLQRQGRTGSSLLLMCSASVIPACLRPTMSLKNLNLLMSMSSQPVCELSRKVIPGSLIEWWYLERSKHRILR